MRKCPPRTRALGGVRGRAGRADDVAPADGCRGDSDPARKRTPPASVSFAIASARWRGATIGPTPPGSNRTGGVASASRSDARAQNASEMRASTQAVARQGLLEVAILNGEAWIDLARLDEAEQGARRRADARRARSGSRARRRLTGACLFWRGPLRGRRWLVGAAPDDLAFRCVTCSCGRVAVGLRDVATRCR